MLNDPTKRNKLDRPWTGPCKIWKVLDNHVYKIRCGDLFKNVHFNRLKPFPVITDDLDKKKKHVLMCNITQPENTVEMSQYIPETRILKSGRIWHKPPGWDQAVGDDTDSGEVGDMLDECYNPAQYR
ncbi:hypothetical protein RF11_01393 [Thelohanellus kitauei]|uniref:Uncharacterized protein n=1 Tax=Thelohanellus kitauei TaxID=669202 RepID=A0A0C2JR17_THEKT|nr:hypothetical protein RF11_01393 [Thelohanellus kitauei]